MKATKNHFRRWTEGLVVFLAGKSFVYLVTLSTSEWGSGLSEVFQREEINIQL
jgi:hypothetical protein